MVRSSMSGFPTLSPLLNVGWRSRPLSKLLMLVRTKADPLPGLTCWNSMISKGSPSTSIFRPLRNSEVSMTPAIAAGVSSLAWAPWEGCLELGANLRRCDAQRVTTFPVVAVRTEGKHDEVVRRDEPHDGDELLGVDADLGHPTRLEERRGILQLRQHRGILDPCCAQVEVCRSLVLKRLHRDAVEAHDAAGQGAV